MSCTKMTEKNPRAANSSSPESDFSNQQWPFQLSDYLSFDDNEWLQIDPTTESFAYQADEVAGGSHIEGSSSSTSKPIFRLYTVPFACSFLSCWSLFVLCRDLIINKFYSLKKNMYIVFNL